MGSTMKEQSKQLISPNKRVPLKVKTIPLAENIRATISWDSHRLPGKEVNDHRDSIGGQISQR